MMNKFTKSASMRILSTIYIQQLIYSTRPIPGSDKAIEEGEMKDSDKSYEETETQEEEEWKPSRFCSAEKRISDFLLFHKWFFSFKKSQHPDPEDEIQQRLNTCFKNCTCRPTPRDY